jgi:hypothetical protein
MKLKNERAREEMNAYHEREKRVVERALKEAQREIRNMRNNERSANKKIVQLTSIELQSPKKE